VKYDAVKPLLSMPWSDWSLMTAGVGDMTANWLFLPHAINNWLFLVSSALTKSLAKRKETA